MPVDSVFDTTIEHVSILDEHANFDASLGDGLIPDDDLVAMYRHMRMCRQFDQIAFKLQRSGRMGTYPENRGQECPSLGAAYALTDLDWLVPCYRENAGLFWRGLPPEKILLHWMGDERGNTIDPKLRITPIAIPIGTQMLHAAGLAWASKYKGDGGIACTFFGDGATSEGDFHEAMNFAANLDLPVVFMCQNNSWAISVPTRIQCSAPTVAQRGLAYGMHTVQCDGNDLFAVVKVVRDAAKLAREENRPTFIEAVTYRLGDHTTADDARRYRDAEELEKWEARDPMIRLKAYMIAKGIWDDARDAAINEQVEHEVAQITSRAENIEPPTKDDIFDYMYEELPENLRRQRDTMRTSSIGQNPAQIADTTPLAQHS